MTNKPRLPRNPATDLDPEAPDRLFTISELAKAFNTTPRAIRFYESRGLISPPRRGVARCYSRRERARLELIQRGKNVGFTLEEIGQWLALYDNDPDQLAQTELLQEKVEAAIEKMSSKRADIDRALKDLRNLRTACMDHLKKIKKK